MLLKVKDVNLTTGGPFVAILNDEDAKELDIKALDKLRVKKRDKELTVTVDISTKGIAKGSLGLFEEVLTRLDTEDGGMVEVQIEKTPDSVFYIKQKMEGKRLNDRKIDAIIADVVSNKLNVVELTYFISACYINGLNMAETIALTRAVVRHGARLEVKKKIIVEKHCIGGVAGNRTTLVVVPIVGAAGLTIPKTSSRSITSASGTADTMEVLAPVALSKKKIENVVAKTNACIVWGGTNDLASADDNFINIERPLLLDPEGILLASIFAKKMSTGATHVVVDLPVGRGAKVETKARAARLKRKFVTIGKRLGIKVSVLLTDGSQPVGNGIGPVLECRDVLAVLKGNGPIDLKNKSLEIAAEMFRMVGIKNGKRKAAEMLASGRAYAKMMEIIRAQGGNPMVSIARLKAGPYSHSIRGSRSGIVVHIDNKMANRIARLAGAPQDPSAGIYLHVKKGASVKKNDVLYTIYAKNKEKLRHAVEANTRLMRVGNGP